MPYYDSMSEDARRRTIRGLNLSIAACREGRIKLRDRRDEVPGLSSDQRLLIELELTRLSFKIDDLNDWKAAFKTNNKALTSPTEERIGEMAELVAVIAEINVINKTAQAIVMAVTEVAGELQQMP